WFSLPIMSEPAVDGPRWLTPGLGRAKGRWPSDSRNRGRPWPAIGHFHERSLLASVRPLTDQLAAQLLIERPGGDVVARHPEGETGQPPVGEVAHHGGHEAFSDAASLIAPEHVDRGELAVIAGGGEVGVALFAARAERDKPARPL